VVFGGVDEALAARVAAMTDGAATRLRAFKALAARECAACPTSGGGKGAACTTVCGRGPASESDCGVVSDPGVTSAGRVTVAANAVPATAAVAMIVRPLLTSSP